MSKAISCYNTKCTQNVDKHCIGGFKENCNKRKSSFNALKYIKMKEGDEHGER